MRPKNSPTNSEIIELTVESLSYHGGRGVGRYQGFVVFVGGVAPADVVRVRITAKKSNFWEAELVQVIKPSPFRRTPPCPVADRCGGCSWQQVSYAQQVEQKEKILRDSLRGLSKRGGWSFLPFLKAQDEFHYRNRVQVHFQGGRYGFFAKRSRDLVAIDKCWIADERLNEKLRQLVATEGARVEIALSESGEVHTMEGVRDPDAALFSQVHQAQNEILKATMLEFISGEPDWLMDLYAGSGNLTFPLARRFSGKALTAVEFSKTAVARGLAASKGFPSLHWIVADTGEGLARIKRQKGRGVVVLDPPRTGLSQQVCQELLRLAPQQIVYVSCNPMTFARDAERLIKNGAFRLEKVQGLDMFPQTEHVELIASLCAAT